MAASKASMVDSESRSAQESGLMPSRCGAFFFRLASRATLSPAMLAPPEARQHLEGYGHRDGRRGSHQRTVGQAIALDRGIENRLDQLVVRPAFRLGTQRQIAVVSQTRRDIDRQ